MSDQSIAPESHDRKYFILTPRIVWGLCETPHEYTLWIVIKDIAGETKECFLSTEDLATLSMMSAGSVSKYRKILIDKKLIIGKLRKDPGYPQPVWHLSIPDLWEENIKFSKNYILIKDRIEYKKSLHEMKASPKSTIEPSADEEGITTDEEGITTDETKKIDKKNEKKKDSTAKAVSAQDENSDPLAGYFGSNGSQPKEQAAQAEKPKKLNKLAAARLRLHTAFAEARGCSLPEWKTDKQKKSNSTNWNKAVDRLMQECDGDLDLAERIIREDVKSYLMGEKDPRYPMVEPRSFESRWVARAIDARMKSALSTPQYFRASDIPQGKTILEFQQEIAGD